jgi:hypothetical protein
MGSVGDAYDNAMCGSFFATLECELLARRRFASQAEARMAVFRFIEGWYNPARRHSGLTGLIPNFLYCPHPPINGRYGRFGPLVTADRGFSKSPTTSQKRTRNTGAWRCWPTARGWARKRQILSRNGDD